MWGNGQDPDTEIIWMVALSEDRVLYHNSDL